MGGRFHSGRRVHPYCEAIAPATAFLCRQRTKKKSSSQPQHQSLFADDHDHKRGQKMRLLLQLVRLCFPFSQENRVERLHSCLCGDTASLRTQRVIHAITTRRWQVSNCSISLLLRHLSELVLECIQEKASRLAKQWMTTSRL
jgi:hypothetical protein